MKFRGKEDDSSVSVPLPQLAIIPGMREHRILDNDDDDDDTFA